MSQLYWCFNYIDIVLHNQGIDLEYNILIPLFSLHRYVHLGCPTLIYQHSTLFWKFITTITKYKKYLSYYAIQIDEQSFCNMILAQRNSQG